MLEFIISLAVVGVVASGLSLLVSKSFTSRWDSRGNYGYKGNQWNKVLAGSTILSVILTGVFHSLLDASIFVSISLGLLVYFLAVTSLTDARSHLIPKELSNLGLIVGALTGLVGFLTAQYYSPEYVMTQSDQLNFQLMNLGVYMLAITMLFVLIMFVPAIGFGDIKMFWVTGLFIGPFFMVPQLLAVFMLMFVFMALQLIFSMIKAKSWKVSGGLPALPAFAVAFVAVTLATNLLDTNLLV